MRVTRDVIQDLLPLYLAGEVSGDTRTLVEEYLDTDPEFANEVRDLAETGLPGDVPVPLTKEDQMEAYKEARRLMVLRTAILAIVIATSVLCVTGYGSSGCDLVRGPWLRLIEPSAATARASRAQLQDGQTLCYAISRCVRLRASTSEGVLVSVQSGARRGRAVSGPPFV